MYKKILVPLDGSELSEAILPHVSKLAKSMGAHVVLLRVVPHPMQEMVLTSLPSITVQHFPAAPEQDLFAHAEGYLQRIAFDHFPDQDITLQVASGPTEENILGIATNLGVDLIAMTTHGRSGLSRMVMGSVADEIVRQSHLPILLLRPPNKS